MVVGEFILAKPFPSILTVNVYVPAGFKPGVHVNWVIEANVTEHCISPSLMMLLSVFESNPVPVITIEFLLPFNNVNLMLEMDFFNLK